MDRGYASMAQTINHVKATPNGLALAEVLKLVQRDIESAKVSVSTNLHRATLETSDGSLIAVCATTARQPYIDGPWNLRFKPPTDARRFRILYFGGLNHQGKAVVHKMTATEIGSKKTITLPA
jgi:hypothetical protein